MACYPFLHTHASSLSVGGLIAINNDATVISFDFEAVPDTKGCKKACLLNAENGAEMTAFGCVTAALEIGSHTCTTSWLMSPLLLGWIFWIPLMLLFTRGREILELEGI